MSVVPRASYRVQLRSEFDFADASDIVPYLSQLGVSHLYCSPYMQAASGSTHGYDVVDPTRISVDLGGDEGLKALSDTLTARDMSQLLDIVPNHMCVSDPRNRWWWDVLQRGRTSRYAKYFDIDWEAPRLQGKVLLPVLGDTLDAALQRRELRLVLQDGMPEVRYYDHRFPLAPGTLTDEEDVTMQLLERQHYVLDFWRTGLQRINYRRFFDVASLAGVRVEDPEVFETTQRRALELVADGTVDGLRVDHVDGLAQPSRYLSALRGRIDDSLLVVEKILAPDERLPDEWPVDGATGYDFAARVTALMVDSQGLQTLDAWYREFTVDEQDFAAHSREARLFVLDTLLESELDRLARVASAAGLGDARSELRALLATMPVYRVYPHDGETLSSPDQAALERASDIATTYGDCDPEKLKTVVRTLIAGDTTPTQRDFRTRFQQLASAAMAKGVEDTAFYRYVRCVALNEVGCEPGLVIDVAQFHEACARDARQLPLSLLATTTHDSKRAEDARLRVAMLTERAEEWRQAVRRWRELALRHRGARAPSAVAEYLFYQTLVAAYPIDADRASAYMIKAVREAKQETSWLEPDTQYESQLEAFVRAVLDDGDICEQVEQFVMAMTPAWHAASLTQTLLKLTSPGVPDIYQGSELWDLRLVDPDNRTPVDFGLRRTMLQMLATLPPCEIARRSAAGLPKLHLIHTALRLRQRQAGSFMPGSTYTPLMASGDRARHVVAFARGPARKEPQAVTIGTRLAYTLDGRWDDTALAVPDGTWNDVLTNREWRGSDLRLADVLRTFPVALLERAA